MNATRANSLISTISQSCEIINKNIFTSGIIRDIGVH
jgi:hypothetical protein